MIRHIHVVRLEIPPCEDAAEHHGVQGLDPATEHFSGMGDRFHRCHLGTQGFNGALGTSGGEDFHTVGVKAVHDGGKSLLVVDGNQGAADGAFHGGKDWMKLRN